MCVCCTEDKKGGVDRSSTVIAKEPEGKANSRDREAFRRFLPLCITYVTDVCTYTYTYMRIHVYLSCITLWTSRDRTGLSHPQLSVIKPHVLIKAREIGGRVRRHARAWKSEKLHSETLRTLAQHRNRQIVSQFYMFPCLVWSQFTKIFACNFLRLILPRTTWFLLITIHSYSCPKKKNLYRILAISVNFNICIYIYCHSGKSARH